MADEGAPLRIPSQFLDRRFRAVEPVAHIDAEIVPEPIGNDLDEIDTIADGIEHDRNGRIVKQPHQRATRHAATAQGYFPNASPGRTSRAQSISMAAAGAMDMALLLTN